MIVQMKFRRGTAGEWSAVNPVLASGEPGFDTTSRRFKVGDGVTTWNGLGFQSYDLDALNSMVRQVDEAILVTEQSAEAATAAAATALGAIAQVNDSVVQGLLNNTTSATRTALNAIISSSGGGGGGGTGDVTQAQLAAAVAAAIAELRDQVPTLEELFVAVPIMFPGETNPINWTSGATRELAIFTAPYPLRLLSLDFTFNTSLPASNTQYISITAERTRADGLSENFISTQTKAIVADAHWDWTQPMVEGYRSLATGEQFGLQFASFGFGSTPPALNGPHVVTCRYARTA